MNRTNSAWQHRVSLIAGTIALIWTSAHIGFAQLGSPPAREDATLITEGTVNRVFVRNTSSGSEHLVQIAVRRAEVAGRANQRGLRYPAPGDLVYVFVDDGQLRTGRGAEPRLPQEGAEIRAYLTDDRDGGWRAVSPDWFEPLATQERPDRTTRVDGESDKVASGTVLGMSFDVIEIQRKLALRVTQLEENGPARRAGLEVGDLVVGVNGQGIESMDQLSDLLRQADRVAMTVIDVNTGRLADVNVLGGGVTTDDAAVARPNRGEVGLPPRTPPPVTPSLGISAERVSVGFRSALKVIRVEPDSPAAKAGLEEGDILVKANGVALTGPEQLGAAVRKAGGTLTLTVRDVRTGRDVPVEISLSESTAEPTKPTPRPSSGGTPGRLGVVTELAFYDVEVTIKITEVEPSSPAARAGLTPGLLILEANGKTLLHPNDLTEAERNSRSLRLTVVDPRTGRKSVVNVDL